MLKDGLVVIDVQYGLSAAHHYKQLLANINQRIDAYHAADHPIIFMQHTDESMPYNGHDLGFKAATIHGLNSTFDTPDLSAQQIIAHHESIWDGSFAEVVRDESVKL